MTKTHDLSAVVGKKSNGKPKWKKFGAILEKDGQVYVKIEAIPLHEGFNGLFSAFPYESKEQLHARVAESLAILRAETKGYEALFPDRPALAMMIPEDLREVILSRISTHKLSEEHKKREPLRIGEPAIPEGPVVHPEEIHPASGRRIVRPDRLQIILLVANHYQISKDQAVHILKEFFDMSLNF